MASVLSGLIRIIGHIVSAILKKRLNFRQQQNDRKKSRTSGQMRQENVLTGFPSSEEEDRNTSFSVILIHDVTEDRISAWSRELLDHSTWTSESYRADVLSYGYDSSSVEQLSELLDPMKLDRHAKKFVLDLSDRLHSRDTATTGMETQRLSKRPIVILAHGYGGLIYERALINTHDEMGDQNVEGPCNDFLAKRCQLAFLFDTPHFAAGLGQWSIMCARHLGIDCAKTARKQYWDPQTKDHIETIKKDQANLRNILKHQDQEGEQAVIEGSRRGFNPTINVVACYATLPDTKTQLILSSEWAVMPEFKAIPLMSDHHGMTKMSRNDNFTPIFDIYKAWTSRLDRLIKSSCPQEAIASTLVSGDSAADSPARLVQDSGSVQPTSAFSAYIPNVGCTKRALLIGSGSKGLEGTENDVDTMYDLLSKRFQFRKENMVKLCHGTATRKGILGAWRNLIERTSDGDSVVIYYSGHGGMAESMQNVEPLGSGSTLGGFDLPDPDANNEQDNPTRFQFLVPVDYDDDETKDWAGILDGEISKFLLETTAKTPNVTYILDCCHSSRLGRALPVVEYKAKFCESRYDRILPHFRQRKLNHELLDDPMWSDPKVVRISAAADTKTALQYKKNNDKWMGMLTEKLSIILRQDGPLPSWRNIMVGVNALFEGEFSHDAPDRQEPRSGGADDRIPFSLQVDLNQTVVADLKDDHVLVRGGRMRGIEKGDVFSLTPLLRDTKSKGLTERPTAYHCTTTIELVQGFSAKGSQARLEGFVMALARRSKPQNPWRIAIPRSLDYISIPTDFERCEGGSKPPIEFRTRERGKLAEGTVALFANDLQIGPWVQAQQTDIDTLFSAASTFAVAQNLLNFGRGSGSEELQARLKVDIGKVRDGVEQVCHTWNTVNGSAPDSITFYAGDECYLGLSNVGDLPYFVSVFHVDAAGKTEFVSAAYERGIRLTNQEGRISIVHDDGPKMQGLPMHWPRSVQGVDSVMETFVFIMTKEEADLGFMKTSNQQDYGTTCEEARKSVTGGNDYAATRNVRNKYDVVHLRYCLRKPEEDAAQETSTRLENIPYPEEIPDWQVSRRERINAAKGRIGGATWVPTPPPWCVTVVNLHHEVITVVVSRYRGRRFLDGGGITADFSGVSLNLETAMFPWPAAKKKLCTLKEDPDGSKATFPFWERKDGCGVVTIFKGFNTAPFIVDDGISAGATAYFTGHADLEIV